MSRVRRLGVVERREGLFLFSLKGDRQPKDILYSLYNLL
jgi:hypothetical protein